MFSIQTAATSILNFFGTPCPPPRLKGTGLKVFDANKKWFEHDKNYQNNEKHIVIENTLAMGRIMNKYLILR